MTFITRSTKTNCIVAASVIGVLLLTLIMVSTLINVSYKTKVLITFVYAISVLVITLFWYGILRLKVFSNYKCQNKLLCADGVISIVMSVLLLICGILFGVLQISTILDGGAIIGSDIRIFIASFIGLLAAWRVLIFILACVKKHFDCWYELVIAIAWVALTVICILSMFCLTLDITAWLAVSFSWLLVLTYLSNVLHSYAISNPQYLETAEAVEILKKEQADLEAEQQFVKAKMLKKATSSRDLEMKSDINSKLVKLRELKDLGLISAEDYKRKKDDILSSI